MADFVAVLRKTLEGLGEPDAALRARVYEKARATVAAKLAALNPPPAPGVAERQRRSLEDAIADVEREYAAASSPATDPLAELENVFASLKNPQPRPIPPPPRAAPVEHAADEPRVQTPQAPASQEEAPPTEESLFDEPDHPDIYDQPEAALGPDLRDPEEVPSEDEPAADASALGKVPAGASPPVRSVTLGRRDEEPRSLDRPLAGPPRRRGVGRWLAAAVVLAMLAGGAFGVWLNKDAFSDLVGLGGPGPAEIAAVSPEPEPGPAETQAPEQPSGPGPGTVESPEPAAPSPVEDVSQQTAKFTQRLTPEGTEVDPGPAGGETGIGEGTSVAALTQPPAELPSGDDESATDGADEAAAAAGQEDTAAPAPGGASDVAAPDAEAPAPSATSPDSAVAAVGQPDASVPVAQKAIFYEERTSASEGSAESGSIVWSLVQESPGSNLPPEPAIRAEATIPGKDVQLRMTIKRNADKSLPASHIIEMIFLTPEGFEGGGIENILRVAMKSSEQEAGNPLIGIPAKIADGFFLVALNDTRAEIDANLTLLRRQSWIDVPLVYKTGRRALLTMEKGIPGDKVFEEALKAWQAATAG